MRWLVALAAGAALLAACGTDTTDLPATPTAAPPEVCEAQDRVLEIIGDIQANPLESRTDLAGELSQIETELAEQAGDLETGGQEDAATQVRGVADAVGDLEAAVSSQDAGQLANAAAALANAVQQLSTLCADST